MNVSFMVFETPDPIYPMPFRTSKDIWDSFKYYGKADREIFLSLQLNIKNMILRCETIAVGEPNSSAVYIRQIFRSAIHHNACSLIFVHNHPSGDPKPSREDERLTKQVVMCGAVIGIHVLDHIIIGRDSFYSFADQGLIGEYEREAKGRLCYEKISW